MSRNPSYLKRRKLGWYVQLAVPASLQSIVGAKVLTRSLKTRDESEARRLRHGVIAELQAQLKRAESAASGATHPLIVEAERLAAGVASGRIPEEAADLTLSAITDTHLEHLAKRHGRDASGAPLVTPQELASIRRASSVLAGRPDESLSVVVEGHLSELDSDGVLRGSTRHTKRQQLEAFARWFGASRSWREVRRRDALDYMQRLKETPTAKGEKGKRLSRSSVVKHLSALRVLFRWLLDREDADTRPANPFDGVQPAKSKRGSETARRPWRPEELSAFLRGVSQDDPMWSLGAIAAYSGARLEEIASLRVSDVEGESFLIREGKRRASVRRVPIHPTIAPLVARLVEKSPDGYVLPYLLTSGADKSRGKLLGKRFLHALRGLGVTDPRVVFHSLRNTVSTQLIAKGVPLERVQLIVGHAELGSTGDYVDAGSVQDVANRKALALVSYGKDLDMLVKNTGKKVTIGRVSRPRPKRGAAAR